MKVTYSVVVLLAVLAATHCYPADKKDEKEPAPNKDVDFVPLEERGHGLPPDGVVDIDAGGDGFFGNPFEGNPFPSLLGSIEALMARMRQQLSQILGRLPETSGDAPFPELHIPNLGDIDLGKGNTTSVTKVIDGHKVTINETEYKQDGDNGASFFKVRIIDVHPDSEETSTEKDAEAVPPPKRDRESVEDPLNNEIPKTKDNEELNFENMETFDEVDLVPPHKFVNTRRSTDWDNIRSVESIEDNSIDAAPQPVRDLSNDIYVNQLLADAGAPTNPDAEVFEVADGNVPFKYYPQTRSQKIVPLSYGYPQQGGFSLQDVFPLPQGAFPPQRGGFPSHQNSFPMNFPASDFEQLGIQHGPMPVFGPLPLPYGVPPMFPMSHRQYGLPIKQKIRQSGDPIVTHSSLPVSNSKKNVPAQQNIQQTSTPNKIQVETNAIPQGDIKQQESSPVSNIPPQSLPVTNAQVPSTST